MPSDGDFCAPALADLIINQIAVQEQSNVVTNPLLHSWQDSGPGNEVTDECRNFFVPAEGNPAALPGSAAPPPGAGPCSTS